MTPNWFVAWPVRDAADWLAGIEAQAPSGLRFTAADDLHVTLAFLGRYEPGLLSKISGLLRGLPLREIEVSPDTLVALPQPRRFSALAFTLGKGRLEVEEQIRKWRDRICREAGARLDTRPPLPHLTIARPDRKIGRDDREATLAWLEATPTWPQVTLSLARPVIYSWADAASSARYQKLA